MSKESVTAQVSIGHNPDNGRVVLEVGELMMMLTPEQAREMADHLHESAMQAELSWRRKAN